MTSGKFARDVQVGLEPLAGVEVVVEVADAGVAGNPWAVDDERDGNAGAGETFGGGFEGEPLIGTHGQSYRIAGAPSGFQGNVEWTASR